MTDINELKTKQRELRARFYPTQVQNIYVRPAPPKDPEAPVNKDIRVDPLHEPMNAEEFGRKIRRGEFPKSEANWRRLITKLAEEHGYTYEDVVGRSRKQKLSEARFSIYTYLNSKMKLSVTRIGKLLQKDHTSVMHGVKRWKEMNGETNEQVG
jgi:chromosomal replication initiation ATPase DnaA